MEEEEYKKKEKTKKFSIAEGSAYSVMDGMGLRNMTPYALALGANNAQIGLLTSIPNLLGNLSQLFTTKAMEKYSRKKVLLFGVILQALMWIPMILIGFSYFFKGLDSATSANFVIFIYTLLVLFGGFVSPGWNSLMSDIVAKEERGKYFGKRNKIVGVVALISLLASGFILDYFKQTKLFIGFAIIFGVCFIARSISAYLISKHHEPEFKLEKGYYFSLRQFIKKIPQSNFGKFVLFVCLVQMATAIASPFFAVYMLKDLGFNYTQYILVVISSSLSSLLFMPIWGKFADKYGNLRIMKICGFFTPFVPLVWLASPLVMNFNPNLLIYYLLFIEFLSGLVWAGFNLTIVNFIYDAVTRQRVALCVAYFNFFAGVGVFVGATLGGFIASMDLVFGMDSILFVFILSFIARMVVYLIMIRKIKEVREVETFDGEKFRKEFKKEVGEEMMYLSYKWMRPRPS
ncbi:MAG: MFS transporter [archaeon]|nr:MFS transporter [archaeon]